MLSIVRLRAVSSRRQASVAAVKEVAASASVNDLAQAAQISGLCANDLALRNDANVND